MSRPRWPTLITILAVLGLERALPDALRIGPSWLFPSVALAFAMAHFAFYRRKQHRLSAIFGFAVDGLLSLQLIISLILLIQALPARRQTPQALLVSAACLWATNILVFALWYWRLDAITSDRRRRGGYTDGAFLFPQMTLSDASPASAGSRDWSPNFIDYVFLAFNTSTAFSPTDAPVLARWAKGLMMIQSLLSLLIVALLAARAVNIL